MEPAIDNLAQLGATAKHIGRRLLTIGENRLELLMVEVQEERTRLLHAFLLAFGVAFFGLLACITLSAVVVVLTWHYSHVASLLILTALYGVATFLIYRRLSGMLLKWQMLSATLEQLRKDRACFTERAA